jgi:DNA-binding MarR family transcriptional regulator
MPPRSTSGRDGDAAGRDGPAAGAGGAERGGAARAEGGAAARAEGGAAARDEGGGAAPHHGVAAVELAVRNVIASSILFNHQVAQRVGLGASDAQFLHFLQLHGPLTPGRLAELSGLTTGTVTGVLDRLENAGFVRRDRDPSDRRKVIVTLDEEHMFREMGPLYAGQAENLAAVAGRYDADQLEVIADFLNALVRESPTTLPER